MFNIQTVEDARRHIIRQIGEACESGADVVVFPETATSAYRSCLEERQEAIEESIDEIRRAVRSGGGPWIVLGTFLFDTGSRRNCALVIDPQGEICGAYHKIQDGGDRWLMFKINGVVCTVAICSDFWVPGILTIPKMLGAQVCFYPHGSGAITPDRNDWSAFYFVRAWESRMYLVMADCSWVDGEPFKRSSRVEWPYEFSNHWFNQTCIIGPDPGYLRIVDQHRPDLPIIADFDPQRTAAPQAPTRFTVGAPWKDMLRYYQENGQIEWIE